MRFLKNFLSFSSGVLISRTTGLLREIFIAYFLGGSGKADAFYVAFRIPSLFRDVLGEQTFNNAFIPAYTESGESREFFWAVFLQFMSIVFTVVLLGTLFAPYLVMIIAPGFLKDPARFHLTVTLTRITFPSLLFFSLSAMFMAILNVRGKFFISAVSPSIINLTIITLPFLLKSMDKSIALAWGLLIGVALQSLILYMFIKEFPSKPDFSHSSLKTFWKLIVPVLVSYSFTEINLFFGTFLASFFMVGSIAYLNYAFRLFHLPVALIGVAMSIVAITDFSRMHALNKDTRNHLKKVLLLNITLTLPTAIILILLSRPLVQLVYQRGNFGHQDLIYTTKVLVIYLLSLPFVNISKILTGYVFSRKDSRTANISFAIGTVVDIITAIILGFIIGIGFYAIAWGHVAGSISRSSYLIYRILLKRE